MKAAIDRIFSSNLAIRENEKILILTDERMKCLASQFYEFAIMKRNPVSMVEVPIAKANGMEPDLMVAQKMLQTDVIFIITTRSLSHTEARAKATLNGARIAAMAGVSEDILLRFAQVDLVKMKQRTNRYADFLDRGNQVQLLTQKGTSLGFSIKGRIAHGRKASIFDRPGYWGNIPCGEAFIAPIEDSVTGKVVVDASIASIGLVDSEVVLYIERGKVIDIKGGSAAEKLYKMLDEIGKRQVAEFGIGTNDKAQVTGVVLEDEKTLGSCHIALGSNWFFGGTNRVNFHVDCVLLNPTIIIDNQKVPVESI